MHLKCKGEDAILAATTSEEDGVKEMHTMCTIEQGRIWKALMSIDALLE